jgi:hypothetical protein
MIGEETVRGFRRTDSGSTAIEKLSSLCDIINPRLNVPKSECESRIGYWKKL